MTIHLRLREHLGRYLPILSWAPTYQRDWWSRDAIAGLTLWGSSSPKAWPMPASRTYPRRRVSTRWSCRWRSTR